MIFKALALLVLLLNSPVFARTGGESGGGGDTGESRVHEIRKDILNWIEEGGAENLKFPFDVTYKDYKRLMSEILSTNKVLVIFIEKDDENNEELQVSVDGRPKTCRGFVSKKTKNPMILCNIARFANTSSAKQYELIHHEYAGLVRLEKNEGAFSDYEISSQITESLELQHILKLSVKKNSSVMEIGYEATHTMDGVVYFFKPKIRVQNVLYSFVAGAPTAEYLCRKFGLFYLGMQETKIVAGITLAGFDNNMLWRGESRNYLEMLACSVKENK